ncbi:MAG TPA: hypothetical protein VH206_13765, partial [Xanthobacteraceae bacterium]|nr:hypothetical protein [Xanthobacteraceae bacterium]
IDAGLSVHGLDHRPCGAFHRAIQASSEQGIHDNVGRHQSCRCGGYTRTPPALRGDRGIAFEPMGVADPKRSHPVSALGENTRDNKTIASIVARPRNDCDVNAGGMAGSDRLGHGATGIFHEVDPGNARRNGAAVRLCHLGGGEQFEHWLKSTAACWRARLRVNSFVPSAG